jgi:hypothetical protein
MLPILRITTVGVVLLAVAILAMALRPQQTAYTQWPTTLGSARGALIAQADHPEWRQFLRLAALQRVEEIQKLRALPDTPARNDAAPPAAKVVGLPVEVAEPEEVTGTIPTPAGPTLPVDIGEPSSTELPVAKREETPPAITPALIKEHHESRARHRKRAAKKPKPEAANSAAPDNAYIARAGTVNP